MSSGSDETRDGAGDEFVDDPETVDDPEHGEADDLPASTGRDSAEPIARENRAALAGLAEALRSSKAIQDTMAAYATTHPSEMLRTVGRLSDMMAESERSTTAWASRLVGQYEGTSAFASAFDSRGIAKIVRDYGELSNSQAGRYALGPLSDAMSAMVDAPATRWAANFEHSAFAPVSAALQAVAESPTWKISSSFDTSTLLQGLEAARGIRSGLFSDWAGVGATLDILARATAGAARELQTRFPGSRPDNWDDEIDPALLDELERILREEGIPLAWVPRPAILRKLIEADDRAARVRILLEHQDLILEDCAESLDNLGEDFAHFGTLGIQAVNAYRAGLPGPALSHAVNVVESAVQHTLGKPDEVKKHIKLPIGKVPFSTLRCFVALYPLAKFYVSWDPAYGRPRPPELSRNVISHAMCGRESEEEPLIAVMYAASVLRGLEDWVEFEIGTVAAKRKAGARS